jgi:hypothetical protein
MKQVVSVAAGLLIWIPTFVSAQSSGPVAEWSFNEAAGRSRMIRSAAQMTPSGGCSNMFPASLGTGCDSMERPQ